MPSNIKMELLDFKALSSVPDAYDAITF